MNNDRTIIPENTILGYGKSLIKGEPMELSNKFTEALAYAFEKHKTQKRKNTQVPYISHLLAVAGLVIENGKHEDEAIAALLHDVVEDQGGKSAADEIRFQFGDNVADLVLSCSDTTVFPKPPYLERKMEHIAKMKESSDSAKLIFAADKLHNARSIIGDYELHGEELWDRFNGTREQILWYYHESVKLLANAPYPRLIQALNRALDQLDAHLS